MELISYDAKKELVILNKNNKNKKYQTTEIFSQDGYIFLLCHKYFLNRFKPRKSFSLECKLLLRTYFDAYINNKVIRYDFEIDKISTIICYNIETQQLCNKIDILESLKLVSLLSDNSSSQSNPNYVVRALL